MFLVVLHSCIYVALKPDLDLEEDLWFIVVVDLISSSQFQPLARQILSSSQLVADLFLPAAVLINSKERANERSLQGSSNAGYWPVHFGSPTHHCSHVWLVVGHE